MPWVKAGLEERLYAANVSHLKALLPEFQICLVSTPVDAFADMGCFEPLLSVPPTEGGDLG